VLPAGDYSRTYAPDLGGDGWAAAALDISLSPELMRVVTGRLMTAMKNGDPRTKALREFFGTLDGNYVTGWDRHNPDVAWDDSYTASDDSHLWHIHLSFYRMYVNDLAALLPIADVIAGITSNYKPSSGVAVEIGADSLSAAEVAELKAHITNTGNAVIARVLQDLGGTKQRIKNYEAELTGLRDYLRDLTLALAGQKSALPGGTKITSLGGVHKAVIAELDGIVARIDKLAAGAPSQSDITELETAAATALRKVTGTITFGGTQ
ncbi:MAG TPA: hypothetical protein VHO01_16410, partial [Jatrophihabitans sp.]|nr:hypothetical protein [Jatrophihabitans sp.]